MSAEGWVVGEQRGLRPSSIRDANCDLVLRLLERGGPRTRAELARESSLTPQALGSILGELVEDGLVRAREPAVNGPGRPSASYELNPSAGYWLGLSVQWRSVLMALVDASGNIRRRGWLAHEGTSDEEILAAAADEARSLVDSVDGAADRLCAVGLSVLGRVDRAAGTVVDTIAWPQTGVPVGRRFEELTGWSTTIDSAARATARAEVTSRGDQTGLVAVLYFSHDPYLILVDEGRVIEGRHGMTGELAHLRVPGGTLPCSCGRTGCMATMVSARTLVERYRRESGRATRAVPEVIEAARQGSEEAKAALEEFTLVTARAATSLLGYLDPSALIISGQVGGPESRGAQRLRELIATELAGTSQADLDIVISPLGRDAHVWGAVNLARRERGLRHGPSIAGG